jgi:phage repressor protein C with HTH and peptisase S24 domain
MEEELKKVSCPVQLQNKRDAYALNLCSRRLGNVLPPRAILFVDPQEPVGSGDIAVFYVNKSEAKIVSIREDENGQLCGLRWKPDEKIIFDDDDLSNLHRVVFISL